jgi:polysaccharide biosynthesis/export protein
LKQSFATVLKIVAVCVALTGCGSYKQNIMFKVTESQGILKQQAIEADRNYTIQKNDYLKLEVYTNSGERIIDPDRQLMKDLPNMNVLNRITPQYLVDVNGIVKLPMIGEHKVEGLTIRKAEEMLQKEYAKFYKDPFVTLEYINKRVVVLGAPGGKVIPLVNENVSLIEILALAQGLDNNARATNIRVLRDDEIFVADLSTFDGYKKSNMIMQHGDIVYIEPIRRPFVEGARDYGPILSLGISITTLMVVLLGLK